MLCRDRFVVSTLTKLTLINIYVRTKFLKFATSLNELVIIINSSIGELDYDLNIGGGGHLHSICGLSKLRSLNIVLVYYNQQLLSLLVSISKRLKKLSIRGHQKYSDVKNMVPSGCEFSFEEYC